MKKQKNETAKSASAQSDQNGIMRLLAKYDVYLHDGPIMHETFVLPARRLVEKRPQKKRALICISTPGGDPHAAYTVASLLRERYSEGYSCLLSAECMSAGTLFALGSRRIFMTDAACLGPLDVQLTLRESSEIRRESGLDLAFGINQLVEEMGAATRTIYTELIKSGIPSSRSAEMASAIVSGTFGRAFDGIDLTGIGKRVRAQNIALHYVKLLDEERLDVADKLSRNYPDHGARICRAEASSLAESMAMRAVGAHADLLTMIELFQLPATNFAGISHLLQMQMEHNSSQAKHAADNDADLDAVDGVNAPQVEPDLTNESS